MKNRWSEGCTLLFSHQRGAFCQLARARRQVEEVLGSRSVVGPAGLAVPCLPWLVGHPASPFRCHTERYPDLLPGEAGAVGSSNDRSPFSSNMGQFFSQTASTFVY